TGTVEAEERAVVKAKTSGSVAEIFVRVGQRVKKGDRLARIDSPIASLDLERARVDLSAAATRAEPGSARASALEAQAAAIDADLGNAKADLAGTERLAGQHAVSPAELERKSATVNELEARLRASRADARALRLDLAMDTAQKRAIVRTFAAKVADTEVIAPI